MAPRSSSAVGALGVLVALSLSGCALTAQITTGLPYSASDGTGATVDGVVAQNMLLVTAGAGDKAALVGSFYNETGAPVTVVLTVEQTKATFIIPSKSTVNVGVGTGDTKLITTTTVAPGLTSDITINVDRAASSTKPVPVMDGTLPSYKEVLAELQATSS